MERNNCFIRGWWRWRLDSLPQIPLSHIVLIKGKERKLLFVDGGGGN